MLPTPHPSSVRSPGEPARQAGSGNACRTSGAHGGLWLAPMAGPVWDQYLRVVQNRAAARIATVADARHLSKKRLPRAVFDYIEGGAGAELTVGANLAALAAVQFRPRVGETMGVPAPELRTSVLGFPVAMPILLSPIGYTRTMDPIGDVGGVRAAGNAGTIFTLSSMSGHTMNEVMAAAAQPAFFQLYFLGGRPGAENLVARALEAGFSGLVLTLDTQITGTREARAAPRPQTADKGRTSDRQEDSGGGRAAAGVAGRHRPRPLPARHRQHRNPGC